MSGKIGSAGSPSCLNSLARLNGSSSGASGGIAGGLTTGLLSGIAEPLILIFGGAGSAVASSVCSGSFCGPGGGGVGFDVGGFGPVFGWVFAFGF